MASQDAVTPEGTSQPTKTTPKDALVMASILKEMGVTEFEPRIINQMAEFAYRKSVDLHLKSSDMFIPPFHTILFLPVCETASLTSP